jgi:glycogen(starch) synthase
MRVICIGLDGRVGQPEQHGYASSWVRQMAQLVDEYVVIAESLDGEPHGPVPLAENATAWLLAGSPVTYPFRAARLAARLHAAVPFDIVTTEDPMRAGLGGALFSARSGVPLNVENHSSHINAPDWMRESIRHRVYNRLGIWVARRADSIRSYSPGQNVALRGIGVAEDRLFVVPASVPPLVAMDRAEARARMGFGMDERVIFSAGRMVRGKNLGVLLEAAARLQRNGRVRVVLAGDGPARAEWEAQGRALGLGDAVVWLGQTPESEMATWQAVSDIYATPSLHETGPRTVLEAYLAGRAVVVTPDMGVTHLGICVHNETALVLDPNDPAQWAEELGALLSDPARADRMAAAGRARMGETYNMSNIARELMDVFEQTVGRKSPATRETARF